MSTSNSYNYTQDRDTIIRSAFEIVGVAVQGESLDSDDITIANRVLNVMLKAFIIHGLQTWKRKTYVVTPLVLNQEFYEFGAHTVSVSGAGTTGTVSHQNHGYSTGDTVTVTGATDTDFNVTDASITVTDTNTYTYTAGGAVSTTESVTLISNYGVNIARPERLLEVNRINSNNRSEMTVLSQNEYRNLPNLTTTGTPIQYHYERRTGAGRMYIWPVADATSVSDDTIELVYQSQIEDMDASTDDLDMPPEWLEPVIWGLADRLAQRYGMKGSERDRLQAKAEYMIKLAKDYDYEDGSVYMQPERR
ncbi:MAG: hypothetical protein OEY29_14430 [Gammaproteobacteria bacterium]|nr:hypothetical protein [Gammaproteobacteria bacterium]